MIYLDNAATTYPKPPSVLAAVVRGIEKCGGNPGRGGHPLSLLAAEEVWLCREAAARLFHFSAPERVVFTQNCTMSLNIALKGLLENGGHALCSDVEHNAVMRPLHALSVAGKATFSLVETDAEDAEKTVENFRRAITPETTVLCCTACSNVTGQGLPVQALGALARERNLAFVVDGAQAAGILPLDMEKDKIDFLCMPGHKGLYGPMGTGLLLCSDRYPLSTWMEGGTGSRSLSFYPPDELPDRLECGTLNVPGICGLRAGIEFVEKRGTEALRFEERRVMMPLYERLAEEATVTLCSMPLSHKHSPLVTFTMKNTPSEQVAEALAAAGIAVRAGYHCAPTAHAKCDTLANGAVRVSPSAFTDRRQMAEFLKIFDKIAKKGLQ